MTKITKEQVELCVNSIELGGYVSSDTTNEIRTYITQLEEKAELYEKALRKAEARFSRLHDLADGGIGFCEKAIAPEQHE